MTNYISESCSQEELFVSYIVDSPAEVVQAVYQGLPPTLQQTGLKCADATP